ncbi:3prime(2prime) [Diplonema papillatum]|nr:3prime(2prime) [Diplonema papillatum]
MANVESTDKIDKMEEVPLAELVAVCVTLAEDAGAVIRAVQREREEGSDLVAELKDADDPRSWLSKADQRAQHVVVRGLRARFPGLAIVAEEDLGDEAYLQGWKPPPTSSTPAKEADARARLGEVPFPLTELSLADVCVFVDPVDGTREFVEGRVMACQTLLGISWRGKPVAGVMGLPFHDATPYAAATPASSARGHTVYGAVGCASGVVGLAEKAAESAPSAGEEGRKEGGKEGDSRGGPDTHEARGHGKKPKSSSLFPLRPAGEWIVATTDSKTPALVAALAVLREHGVPKTLPVGACGNKVLKLLTGEADVALFNLGTCLWDTCAPRALLECQGGELGSLFGCPIEHFSESKDVKNRLGVLCFSGGVPVASRQAAWAQLRGTEEVQLVLRKVMDPKGLIPPEAWRPQAVDVMRDANGDLFTPASLGVLISGTSSGVDAFTADEADTVRYKMSYACRLRLYKADDPAGKVPEGSPAAPAALPSAFYKRIVFRDMPYAVAKSVQHPFKMRRDVASATVEASFLSSPALVRFAETSGVRIALPHHTQQYPVTGNHPLDARFCSLLQDFAPADGWVQKPLLDEEHMLLSLAAFAQFHAFFWGGVAGGSNPAKCAGEGVKLYGEGLRGQLWTTGTYWDLAKQPGGQVAKIAESWRGVLGKFSAEFARYPECGVAAEDDQRLGEVIAEQAVRNCVATHGVGPDGRQPTAGSCGRGASEEAVAAWLAEFEAGRTVIHGDSKAANIFFKEDGRPSDRSSVGLIDYQWTGDGLCATDIAYFMAASPSPAAVPLDGSKDQYYLRHYHTSLLHAFVQHRVAATPEAAEALYPFATFESHYQTAFLDLSRVILCDHLSPLTLDVIRSREGKQGFNAYNKSVPVALWVLSKMKEFLRKKGLY